MGGRVKVGLVLPRALDRALEVEAARIDVNKSDYVAAAIARLLQETTRLPPAKAKQAVQQALSEATTARVEPMRG